MRRDISIKLLMGRLVYGNASVDDAGLICSADPLEYDVYLLFSLRDEGGDCFSLERELPKGNHGWKPQMVTPYEMLFSYVNCTTFIESLVESWHSYETE